MFLCTEGIPDIFIFKKDTHCPESGCSQVLWRRGRGYVSEEAHCTSWNNIIPSGLKATRVLLEAGRASQGKHPSTYPQAFSSFSLQDADTQQSMSWGVGRVVGSHDMPPRKSS